MFITGIIKNKKIITDKPLELPDGTEVSILIKDVEPTKEASGLCGIWKDERAADDIVNEIISARSKGRKVKL